VEVFRIVRPVESAALVVAVAVLVAALVAVAVLAIIVRGVYDLASHVVEQTPIPQWYMITI
jgi:hypothetical protein